MSDNEIRVKFPGGVRVDAEYHGFTMKTDQPVSSGGAGSAPSPFDLFLASLATCAGYYVLAFCQGREISTAGLGLSMRTERDPAGKMIRRIFIDISLPPGFPEQYIQAAARAAEKCAVKAHLQQAPEIVTKAAVRTA
jgi:putative redox protein